MTSSNPSDKSGGSEKPLVADRRDEERQPSEEQVVVKIHAAEIPGPSRDISRQGLYFVAKAPFRVEVVFDNGKVIPANLVRLGMVREGEMGVAVRFDEPLPEELLPPERGE